MTVRLFLCVFNMLLKLFTPKTFRSINYSHQKPSVCLGVMAGLKFKFYSWLLLLFGWIFLLNILIILILVYIHFDKNFSFFPAVTRRRFNVDITSFQRSTLCRRRNDVQNTLCVYWVTLWKKYLKVNPPHVGLLLDYQCAVEEVSVSSIYPIQYCPGIK